MQSRRTGTICSLVLIASFMCGTPATAWADTMPEAIVTDSSNDSVNMSLLAQARLHVDDLQLWQAPPQQGSTTSQSPTEAQRKKAALIIGLAGAGTAVAGIFVWRGAPSSNLPGITSGRRLTGQLMVGTGSVLAFLGLMAARK